MPGGRGDRPIDAALVAVRRDGRKDGSKVGWKESRMEDTPVLTPAYSQFGETTLLTWMSPSGLPTERDCE